MTTNGNISWWQLGSQCKVTGSLIPRWAVHAWLKPVSPQLSVQSCADSLAKKTSQYTGMLHKPVPVLNPLLTKINTAPHLERDRIFYIFKMHYCKQFWLLTAFKNSSTNFLIPVPKAFPRIKFYIISSQQLTSCLPDTSAYLRSSGQEVISYLYTTFTLSSIKMIYKLCHCWYLKKPLRPI